MKKTIHRGEGDVNKVTTISDSIEVSYFVTKPSRWTFADDKIRGWLLTHLSGRVLNACAGKTKLDYSGEIIRNDLNSDRDADTHVDVREISDHFEESSFDTIIYDPPFNKAQADEKYDGIYVADAEGTAKAKREFDRLLASGGKVIQFGFTTTNMPGELGYSRQAIAIFNTLGNQYDVLGTVDRKLNSSLSEHT